MTKKRNTGGFTLAEMLIVVAIIVVLMGVSFVAVQNYQRSMTRMEFDNVAKEIFFAAQNHLTAAQSQGYLENSDFGHAGSKTSDDPAGVSDKDIYYLISTDTYPIMNVILPRYSLDATMMSGSFIIRYQPSSAKILDVFYSLDGKSSMLTVKGSTLGSGDFSYDELMSKCRGTDKTAARQNYSGAVVGWYGDEKAVETGTRLRVPTFEVFNEETLYVKLTDPNMTKPDGYSLKLIVIGKESEAEKYFDLIQYNIEDNQERVTIGYQIVLDDITDSKMHFADLKYNKPGKFNGFIPGEDLIIKAVAYSKSSLANIAMSAEKTTNSLFADPYTYVAGKTVLGSDVGQGVAAISNFRHFENLDASISNLEKNDFESLVKIKTGVQTAKLDWDDFKKKTGNNTVYTFADSASADGCMLPVTPRDSGDDTYPLTYLGQGYSVSNVKANHTGAAGLFGELPSGSSISNLELIDFEITGTTSAGALVGTANGTEITNVVAHNSVDESGKEKLSKNIEATGAAGSAGGLIGSMSGGSVTKSAAAVYVKGGTAAGGLIGSVTGDNNTVTACYSGGHTISGKPDGAETKYDGHADIYPVRYDPDHCNVTAASGTAGGLIGTAGNTEIKNSYSTCSASGTTAGGFVGSSTGNITNCYCTGLVMKPGDSVANHGAFAGTADMSKLSNCQFFEIINEIKKDENDKEINGYDYLRPLGNVKKSETAGVTAFDASADSYNSFVGAQDAWTEAKPYDTVLEQYYKITKATGEGETQTSEAVCGYNLKSVSRLDSSVSSTDFVATHYGDWPAPEEFIFN